MLFNSGPFAVFLPLVFAIYWFIGSRRPRLQNVLLLAASYGFYSWWDWRYLSLIIFTSFVHFMVGRRIHASDDSFRRRAWLAVSLITGLGALAYFKYFNFFIDSLADILAAFGLRADLPALRLVLPLGISFYTLQALSYPLAIYHGRCEPTRQVVDFFAFVSFFPQLLAGPIERAYRMLPQFQERRVFDPAMARDGLRQIANGLLKKALVADNLAPHVEAIFSNASQHDGATLLIGAFFFSLQVYCDFSGYSDIAIGTARLFGFSLMQNFRYPLFARDIGEFWRRWHISLSTWLRDYVFAPLGGAYGSRGKQILNVALTFTVSGLWHGAAWTYIVWGAINGLYFVPQILGVRLLNVSTRRDVAAGRVLPRPREAIAIMLTFVSVMLAFVFFRSDSLSTAVTYTVGIFSRSWVEQNHSSYQPMLWVCAVLLTVEWIQRREPYALQISHLPRSVRWVLYLVCTLAFLFFGKSGTNEFIYLQF